MSNKKLPTIAIIGQANVGKSSLFNRMIGKRQAIVAKEAGTTRDNVIAKLQIEDRTCWLVDTAGLKTAEDEFEASIQEQIGEATELADVILVTLDGTLYPTNEDIGIIRKAQKSNKPTFLLVNKSDLKSNVDQSEFYKLGLKEIIFTSANHGTGIEELKNKLLNCLPVKITAEDEDDDKSITISLIGRPNVGKSFLFNTLAGKQQAVVANVAGTTRDLNRISIKYKGQLIELIDTAGIRKPGKQETGIEKFSVLRTLQAIEESDVCLMLVDGTDYGTQLDQKLAGVIDEAGKGMIVVVTKSDLIPEEVDKDSIIHKMAERFKFAPYAPLIFTSSVTGKNVTKIFELASEIINRRRQNISTSKLNQVLQQAKLHHVPAGLKNSHPKLRYMVQTDTNPPWFVIYGSDLKFLHWSYKRYLDRVMRDNFDYIGTPIKFSFKETERKERDRK